MNDKYISSLLDFSKPFDVSASVKYHTKSKYNVENICLKLSVYRNCVNFERRKKCSVSFHLQEEMLHNVVLQ